MSRSSTSPIQEVARPDAQSSRRGSPRATGEASLHNGVRAEAAEAFLIESHARQHERRCQRDLVAGAASVIGRADRLVQVTDQPAAGESVRQTVVQLMRLAKDLLPAADRALEASPDGRAKDILRGTVEHSRSVLLQCDAGTIKNVKAELALLAGVCRLLLRFQEGQ
ncbi:hypothetical protein EES41_23130 [Streptomyces sp. ADI95-16]|nr:hypothetical protein EES41_23130 [Streptomyces sp. ADI95-16]